MRHCGQIIDKAIKRQGVKQKDLAEYVGTTPQNMSKIIGKETLDASALEKICMYLNLDPADFFDWRPDYARSHVSVRDIEQTSLVGSHVVTLGPESTTASSEMTAGLLAAKDALLAAKTELIAEKDKRIEALERMLALLQHGQSDVTGHPG